MTSSSWCKNISCWLMKKSTKVQSLSNLGFFSDDKLAWLLLLLQLKLAHFERGLSRKKGVEDGFSEELSSRMHFCKRKFLSCALSDYYCNGLFSLLFQDISHWEMLLSKIHYVPMQSHWNWWVVQAFLTCKFVIGAFHIFNQSIIIFICPYNEKYKKPMAWRQIHFATSWRCYPEFSRTTHLI